jgi:hypothetical protein
MRSGKDDFGADEVVVVAEEEESGVAGGGGWKDCGGYCNEQMSALIQSHRTQHFPNHALAQLTLRKELPCPILHIYSSTRTAHISKQ